ncbi:Senescence regulator [Parasponia andersonii]|uniref:Senescence regulator n=1 Tax=Parasponia andersonii TaxID=3476 RepID=A0A2P5C0P3_PARAD|nr:Senescence regulator [Parasponia andersonii]
MAEEFQESEVIFSGDDDDDIIENRFDFEVCAATHGGGGGGRSRSNNSKSFPKKKKGMAPNSMPVNIPADNVLRFKKNTNDSYEWGDDQEELVPPHLIVKRRIAGGNMMAYSVCTGNGRTLKGRDLSQVRNSILRMTGFLET